MPTTTHTFLAGLALILGVVAGLLELAPAGRFGHVFGWFAVAALAASSLV